MRIAMIASECEPFAKTGGLADVVGLPSEETRDRLRLEAYTDKLLHGPVDAFKATVAGITDYTNAYVTYQPGSFKLLHAPQLPFLFPSPQVVSSSRDVLGPEQDARTISCSSQPAAAAGVAAT